MDLVSQFSEQIDKSCNSVKLTKLKYDIQKFFV